MAQPSPYSGLPQSMPPTQKSKTGLWIGLGCGCLVLLALIVGGIALALSLMGGDDSKKSQESETATTSAEAPAPNPSETSGGESSTPAPGPNDGGNETDPTPAPAPQPEPGPDGEPTPVEARGGEPQQFADFVLIQSDEPHQPPQNFDIHALYEKSDGTQVEVGAGKNADRTAASVTKDLPGAQKIGRWTCVTEENGSLSGCVTQDDTHGYVAIASITSDLKTLAASGDQFIGALNEQQ
ncbi:hypothetical protein [Dermabacter vaginalis]|uniref:hypothetical protein n=1 Tax=Dermabacter vaginalis TaxID=1630135 RepID=UPI001EF6A151|nr:hypothetical protein [Dermabacter vaginalis]MCG7443652.1 hypothetical protein [Dermabacter vaginalis]